MKYYQYIIHKRDKGWRGGTWSPKPRAEGSIPSAPANSLDKFIVIL